ncbi:hypothetical protein [Thalassoglobus sp.]|uniref:hypothetical protein n=1 Tax=Thalassoglobus sp. TaxID=2795869 RepID=UPI003AA86B7A
MARHFSLPSVLRQVPNELLQRFFTQLPVPCYSIDWTRMGQRQAEHLVNLLRLWPSETREFVEDVLRNVFDLACDRGQQALREAATELGESVLLDRTLSTGNLYHRTMRVWLDAPDVFEKGLVYHQIEHQGHWRKRDDLPTTAPRTDQHALESLGSEISRLLVKEQGRGQHCTVEYFQRENGMDYFCCYPDDFVRTVTMHDDQGDLQARSVRQTFEIVYAFHQPTGTLEMSAVVPTKLRRPLENAFAWMILDTQLGPRIPRQVYHLNRLKDRDFQLETLPTDDVHVELKKLRLDLPGGSRRIVLESTSTSDDVFRMVDECLNEDEVPLEDVQISSATLRFLFRRTANRRRGSMTINISAPNTCNLRNHPEERIEIARRHLRMWRISND